MAERKKPTDTGTNKQGAESTAPAALSPVTEETVKKVATRKRGTLPPEESNYLTEQGDNTKYLKHTLAMWNWGAVDWMSEQAVSERVFKYFQLCADNDMKPSVTGLAFALDINRTRLWEIANDKHPKGDRSIVASNIIKKAYAALENQWADYMQNGKVNPASGIFLGKNYYGYTDEQKITVKPDNPLGDAESAESVRQKYLEEGDTDD